MIKAVLAITGSDYTKYVGGTNRLILSHQRIFIENGLAYVCIFPYRIFDRNKDRNSDYWCIRVNGELRAVIHIYDIADYFVNKKICIEEIHVHQLLNISINSADKLLSSFNTERIRIFLHDYQYICKNYLMLRNDSVFCGPEAPNTEKCNKCKYCSATNILYKKMQVLFHKYKGTIEMIAPSKYVEDFYTKCFPELKIITVPHQVPVGQYHKPLKDNDIFKVAFVGYANKTKGWEYFEKATRNYDDDKIQYFHFGKGGDDNASITHVIVDTSRNPDDMVNSLRRNMIDFCVLWSIVPESYSYAYNECLMAGACIITSQLSGNIAQSVILNGSGVVLNNADELRDLVTNYEKLKDIRSQLNFKAPMAFKDNDWICKNIGHSIGVKSQVRKRIYDHVAMKVIYLLKWVVKGK